MGSVGNYNEDGDSSEKLVSKKLQQTQEEVNEVVEIMRSNVDKVLERNEKLDELSSRAEILDENASRFNSQAVQLKRKMWWKDLKMKIILGSGGAALLVLVIWLI